MATLQISGWESRCMACYGGADPNQTHHTTLLPGLPGNTNGCGAEFTSVSIMYAHIPGTPRMRPDLPEGWED